MKFPIGKNPGNYVLLCSYTQFLVFIQNLPVKCVDILKLFIGRISVAVNLVFDLARGGRYWNHALDVEELISRTIKLVSVCLQLAPWSTHVTVTEVVG